MDMRINWADYCSKYYHVECYKEIYAPEMGLLIGREERPKPLVEINPPIDMRKPGRPCKKRKREHDELHSEKVVGTCKRCKMPGHNRRTCAGAPVGSNPKQKYKELWWKEEVIRLLTQILQS